MSENPQLDQGRQVKAKQYARISRRLMLLSLAFGGTYVLLWLVTGWSPALRDALMGLTTRPWLLAPLYALVFGGIYYLIDLPLSYYNGFILPHRFDQSNQTFKGWILDEIKGIFLSGLIGVIVLEVIYLVLRSFPQTWWLWAAGFMFLFSVLLGTLAPVLLMPLFYKITPLDEERKDLVENLQELARQAGTRLEGVYKFDMSTRTKSANAALTGLGKTRRVILGDTLLDEFTNAEIETILAHELAHHVHKDIPIGIAVETVVTLVGFYLASLVLDWGIIVFGFTGPGDIAGLPLLLVSIGVYGLITMPLGNAFSRWREVRADRYALEVTQDSEAFAAAFTRLANQNLADVDPEPWVEFLLYSHPALNKRIAMSNGYTQEDG